MAKARVAPAPKPKKLSKRDREWGARFDERLKNLKAALERLVAAKERGGEAWEALAKPRDLRLLQRLTRGSIQSEESTTTPEDTLRDAGISSKRQARSQRRMSSLLAKRAE